MKLRTMALAAGASLAAALIGLGAGALIFGGSDSKERELREELRAAESRIGELEKLLNEPKDGPIFTPAAAFPQQDAAWDPCSVPGLCEFTAQVDSAFRQADTDRVLALIRWTPVDCAQARAMPSEAYGVIPVQCLDWPFEEMLPTVAMGLDQSEGAPVPPWEVRRDLSGRFAEANGRCFGQPFAVIAITESPNPDFMYAGEAGALVGPPPDTCAQVRKYHVAFARDQAGEWHIQGFVLVGGLGFLDRPDGRELYVSRFRYWPLNEN